MSRNSVYMIFAFLAFLVLGFFLFYTPDDGGNQSQQEKEEEAVAALFGGGSSGSPEGGSGSSPSRRNSDSSLFEDQFWKTGEPSAPIAQMGEGSEGSAGGTEILEPVSEGNPVNPQTGQPYTDSDVERFKVLQEKFPGNSVIPRRMTPEEKEEEQKTRQKMFAIQSSINSGNASPEEVNTFYDHQLKQVEDRMELLNYVIETQGDRISPDFLERYQKVLEMNEKQKESFEKARERDLKRVSGQSGA